MRRHPDLGQTSTSYLGMVALAAALIAAVLALGVPAQVGAGLERAICTITAGHGCGGSGAGGGEVASEAAPPTPLEVATSGRFVALGDSFSSGEGAYDYEAGSDRDGECHRSTHAYAYELAGDLDFDGGSSFVACSGAKARNVLEGQEGEPAQIDAVDETASLVTIGIGGNDAGWTDVILACLIAGDGGCASTSAAVDDHLDRAADRALEVYREARDRAAPGARVVAVGYPRFFPEDPDASQYDYGVIALTTDEQRYLNAKTRRFNELLAARADEAGVEFVDLTAAFAGHEFGSDDSYFNGAKLRVPTTFSTDAGAMLASAFRSETLHPNAQGQRAMAKAVRRQVVAPQER